MKPGNHLFMRKVLIPAGDIPEDERRTIDFKASSRKRL